MSDTSNSVPITNSNQVVLPIENPSYLNTTSYAITPTGNVTNLDNIILSSYNTDRNIGRSIFLSTKIQNDFILYFKGLVLLAFITTSVSIASFVLSLLFGLRVL